MPLDSVNNIVERLFTFYFYYLLFCDLELIQAYIYFIMNSISEKILTYYLLILLYSDPELIIMYLYLYVFHLFFQDWCLRWHKNDAEYVPKRLRHKQCKIVTRLSNYITKAVDIYAKSIGIGSSIRSTRRRQRKIAKAISRVRTTSRGSQSYAYRSKTLLVVITA